VTEQAYGLREESPPEIRDQPRQRIFFPHPLAQRTTQWERGDEPMTQFGFTDDYDAYGQSRRKVSLAVPRHRNYRAAAPARRIWERSQKPSMHNATMRNAIWWIASPGARASKS
jgi:hypothetical protein